MSGALTEVSGGVTADGFSPSGKERPSREEMMARQALISEGGGASEAGGGGGQSGGSAEALVVIKSELNTCVLVLSGK